LGDGFAVGLVIDLDVGFAVDLVIGLDAGFALDFVAGFADGAGLELVAAIAVPVMRKPEATKAARSFFKETPPFSPVNVRNPPRVRTLREASLYLLALPTRAREITRRWICCVPS
jgi:hypothetical protein